MLTETTLKDRLNVKLKAEFKSLTSASICQKLCDGTALSDLILTTEIDKNFASISIKKTELNFPMLAQIKKILNIAEAKESSLQNSKNRVIKMELTDGINIFYGFEKQQLLDIPQDLTNLIEKKVFFKKGTILRRGMVEMRPQNTIIIQKSSDVDKIMNLKLGEQVYADIPYKKESQIHLGFSSISTLNEINFDTNEYNNYNMDDFEQKKILDNQELIYKLNKLPNFAQKINMKASGFINFVLIIFEKNKNKSWKLFKV